VVRPRTSLREAEGGRKVSSGQGSEDCKEGWWENIGLGLFFFSGRWSDPSDKWEYDGTSYHSILVRKAMNYIWQLFADHPDIPQWTFAQDNDPKHGSNLNKK